MATIVNHVGHPMDCTVNVYAHVYPILLCTHKSVCTHTKCFLNGMVGIKYRS